MPRLFWLGSPFFSKALEGRGFDIRSTDFQEMAVFGWDDIVRMAGFEPDVLVVADKSRPPFVTGVESFPCLTVFYCVDSHIHSWYPYYAQAFDICLMSLRDHIPAMLGRRLTQDRVWWTPAFAKDDDRPRPQTFQWDVMFVGTVDATRTPKRHAFMSALRDRVPGLAVRTGDYRSLYPEGRIILNYCEHGDLNFRVFEALGCGGCLVTPRIGHGLLDLFPEGQALATYPPDDMDALVPLLEGLLASPERCATMRREGLALIDAAHRAQHRAASFMASLERLPDGIVERRRAKARDIHSQWLRMVYLLFAEQLAPPYLKQKYLEAARTDARRV